MNRFFFAPEKSPMWDTWIYYHQGAFYLYSLVGPPGKWHGVGLAISQDGVRWTDHGKVINKAADAAWVGSGAVYWVANGNARERKFLMNFHEGRDSGAEGNQTIFFAESPDLVHWTRLSADYEFSPDDRWYAPKGRWDGMWVVPRSDGSFFGYWTATPREEKVGVGFGESTDGLTWEAREPPALLEVSGTSPKERSPEVSAVYRFQNKYYLLAGLDDLAPLLNDDGTDFRPGHTVFIGDVPEGPFRPASRNRRILVGNAAYFLRFVDTPDGVLANHHSWEISPGELMDVDGSSTCLAPLKRAEWDEEGTLRLKWWEKNDLAKIRRVELEPTLLETAFELKETLILEGEMVLSSRPTGLYLQGSGDKGSGFIVRDNGSVRYGDVGSDGSGFEEKGYVDRELSLEGRAPFRLMRKGRITEFYINDYLMQCYCLPERGTGRIGLMGPAEDFSNLRAWYCAR